MGVTDPKAAALITQMHLNIATLIRQICDKQRRDKLVRVSATLIQLEKYSKIFQRHYGKIHVCQNVLTLPSNFYTI